VNGVNGGDTVFVICVSVYKSVHSGPANQINSINNDNITERHNATYFNLVCMFPRTVPTESLIFLIKMLRDSLKFTWRSYALARAPSVIVIVIIIISYYWLCAEYSRDRSTSSVRVSYAEELDDKVAGTERRRWLSLGSFTVNQFVQKCLLYLLYCTGQSRSDKSKWGLAGM